MQVNQRICLRGSLLARSYEPPEMIRGPWATAENCVPTRSQKSLEGIVSHESYAGVMSLLQFASSAYVSESILVLQVRMVKHAYWI